MRDRENKKKAPVEVPFFLQTSVDRDKMSAYKGGINMPETRIEKDSSGEIAVPSEHYWGAQTQRSLKNFKIGEEKMPSEIIKAFAYLKKAAAVANNETIGARMTGEKCKAICGVCDEIISGKLNSCFICSFFS